MRHRQTFNRHVALHTFSTTVTLLNGISLESVANMIGHKSTSHTKRYARVIHTKVCKEIESAESEIKKYNEFFTQKELV